MSDTRELIDMAFNGEVPEEFLMEQLGKRSDREIIEDLKELPFESLINTEECLNDYLDTMSELDEESRKEQQGTIEQTEKSLGYLHVAIKERCNELIDAEKRVKKMLR